MVTFAGSRNVSTWGGFGERVEPLVLVGKWETTGGTLGLLLG